MAGARESVAGAIDGVDAARLADELDATLTAVGLVAAALAGRAAVALAAYGLGTGAARGQTQWFALAATKSAAATDAARLRKLAGADAARRYGAAVRRAATGVRFLSRALSLVAGPAGWLVLELPPAAREQVLVLPENWDALRAFIAVQTQWRYGPSGHPTGLDYAGCKVAVRALGLRWGKVFEALREMDAAALEARQSR